MEYANQYYEAGIMRGDDYAEVQRQFEEDR